MVDGGEEAGKTGPETPQEQGVKRDFHQFPMKDLNNLARAMAIADTLVVPSDTKKTLLGGTNVNSSANEDVEMDIRKLAGKDQGKKEHLEERASEVFGLVESLLPPRDELDQAKIEIKKDNPAIARFFSSEDVLRNIRTLDFLLDTNIIAWWLSINDANFQKLKGMVERRQLPSFLVSQSEAVRLLTVKRGQLGILISEGLRRQENPMEANVMIRTHMPVDAQMETAVPEELPARPGRLSLLDAYTPETGFNPDLDIEQVFTTLSAQYKEAA